MRFRKLRIAWSVLFAIVCLLLIVLWVRSYWRIEAIMGRMLNLSSLHGRIVFDKVPQRRADVMKSIADDVKRISGVSAPAWDVISYPYERSSPYETNRNFGLPQFPGFKFYSLGDGTIRLVVPHWFVLLTCLAMSAAPWFRWSNRFSLRTLLIATTLVAVVLGLAIYAGRK